MLRYFIFLTFSLLCSLSIRAQHITFELDSAHNRTATYTEVLSFYRRLDSGYKEAKLFTFGNTDVGKPLQLMVLSKDGDFDPASIRKKGKSVILFNNGIHPGEPEGIDASMMLIRDLLANDAVPDKVVLCFIPVYNIDGMLNRGVSRVNQNGPEQYGFRGNRQHLDLNRDFIKTDSHNSWAFQEIFNTWDPDVFMDNHASNGADYQYIMTLIDTQRDKLNPVLSSYMLKNYTEELYQRMGVDGYRLVPYVDPRGETPESGIVSFLENPRYSTGYAALHNTIAYMPETHMWKPFTQRVRSTYALMKHLIDITDEQGARLLEVRAEAKRAVKEHTVFPLTWTLDTLNYSAIDFYGYEALYRPSEVSGQPRLYYDRSKPFTKKIRLYDRYKPKVEVKKPIAYVIPQAYEKVLRLLALNGVKMQPFDRDTTLELEMYYIKKFNTLKAPFEGHYVHSDVELTAKRMTVPFYAGDVLVKTDQAMNRYIVETLEPQAVDSYFSWNFFDAVLGQKEHFSAYIFEDEAARLLKSDEALRTAFENAKKEDPALGKNGRAQLDWIYKQSPYYEKTHLLYPVGRLID
ncbi:M14 family zinc carboxypeptidase [Olivibacter sp. XZL3]|uniref:M14 family zinc carboxypeptidase n=1 Tax=Olivibacter sp. XZL3 TaxID=1735116 RepID=UPI0010649D8F|nr:M14 family zinc carboxypeptidase [Olivibacter sp. XZL3]